MITTDITLGTTVASPMVSKAVAGPVPVSQVATPSGAVNSKTDPEMQSAFVDRVTLQGHDQNTEKGFRKEKTDIAVSRIGSVLFSYNSKGDLRIRFMDSANSLVYQTPPLLIARIIDIMRRADSSVNNNV